MKELLYCTGQMVMIDKISRKLRDNEKYHWVSGPSGSGKSYAVKELCNRWQAEGGVYLYALGDKSNAQREYYPFKLSFRDFELNHNISLLKKLLIKASEDVPIMGATASQVINYLLNYRSLQITEIFSFLSEEELNILLHLHNILTHKKSLFVADNFQYWDDYSKKLLIQLLSRKFTKQFDFLNNFYVIVVNTADLEDIFPDSTVTIRSNFRFNEYSLNYCSETEYHNILKLLGLAKDLPVEMERTLFKICGGHLEINRKMVDYINNEDRLNNIKLTNDHESILFEGLKDRLFHLGESGKNVNNILEAASIIGNSFKSFELKCLTEKSETEIKKALDIAADLSLVDMNDDMNRFSHDYWQVFFNNRAYEKLEEYHSIFAECIREINPSDYGMRAHHYLHSNQSEKALDMVALNFLKTLRNGRCFDYNLEVSKLTKQRYGHEDYLGLMNEAFELFNSGQYDLSLQKLEGLEELYSDALIAEKDILIARCCLKMADGCKKEYAVQSLERWDHLRHHEIDIWCRVAIYLIIAYIYSGDLLKAKFMEKEIMRLLQKRLVFDPGAKTSLNKLRLRADVLYSNEVSRKRLLTALAFFGPDNGNNITDIVHYFIALCNLAGNYLAGGEYSKAFDYGMIADRVIKDYNWINFPRLDIFANNLLVSAFLSGHWLAEDCGNGMAKILESGSVSNDSPILASNYAVLCAHQGDLVISNNILEEQFNILSGYTDTDEYYYYFVGNNLAGIKYALGDKEGSMKMWQQVSSYLDEISLPVAIYLKRRHELQNIVYAKQKLSIYEWDTYIRNNYSPQIGPCWDFWGRGLLFSDLQFWTDE